MDKLFGVKVTVDHGLSVLRLYCVPASLSCAANAKAAQRTTLLLFHFSQTRDASHIHISCFHSSSIQQHQNSFKSLCGLPDRSLRNVQITICYLNSNSGGALAISFFAQCFRFLLKISSKYLSNSLQIYIQFQT